MKVDELQSICMYTEYKEAGLQPLDWETRVRISIGAARGLAYLHHDCVPRIIHRDIKASNILLDEEWEPRIADFGLAKLMNHDQTHVTTMVAGTLGYVAPGTTSTLSCPSILRTLQTVKTIACSEVADPWWWIVGCVINVILQSMLTRALRPIEETSTASAWWSWSLLQGGAHVTISFKRAEWVFPSG